MNTRPPITHTVHHHGWVSQLRPLTYYLTCKTDNRLKANTKRMLGSTSAGHAFENIIAEVSIWVA